MRQTHRSQHLPTELQTFRQAYPLLERCIYLANCSQGPQSRSVRTAIETFLTEWSDLGMHWDAWVTEVERARSAFAGLIGAEPGEIAVGSTVSQLVSSVASALAISPEIRRRRIISSVAEFPGVAHAWLAMQAHGYCIDNLPANDESIVDTANFVTAIDETTVLVSAPHVCSEPPYRSSHVFPSRWAVGRRGFNPAPPLASPTDEPRTLAENCLGTTVAKASGVSASRSEQSSGCSH
jgi:kynureninase